MNLLLIIAVIVIVYLIIKHNLYKVKYDHTLMFTGAPGTGKTLKAVDVALKLYRKVRKQVKRENRKIARYNLIHKDKKELKETPKLYSNIPIRINSKEFSYQFTEQHAFLQHKLAYKSVVFITELGKFARKHDWNNPYNNVNIDEFISLYRQYTQGGYFIADDQSHAQVFIDIRERIGTVINMLHLRKFWILYLVQMRKIHISEGITTIEENHAEDNMTTHIGIFPLFRKKYDTYAFSERYITVPFMPEYQHQKYKINKYLQVPKVKIDRNGTIIGDYHPPKTTD